MSKRSDLVVKYTARGLRRYEIEVTHLELHKHQWIKGSDSGIVARKADLKMMEWDEMWAKKCAVRQRAAGKAASLKEANDRTQEAHLQPCASAGALPPLALQYGRAKLRLRRTAVNAHHMIDWEPCFSSTTRVPATQS